MPNFPHQPVTVVVCPTLDPVVAVLPARDSSVTEADATPLLLLIADVEVNGGL